MNVLFPKENSWAGSLARLGHLLDVQFDAGSVDWHGFDIWIYSKYSKSYAPTIHCYAKKHGHLLSGNLRELDLLSASVKNATIKSLIVLSKFLGVHKEFKMRLEDYGIKMSRPDVFASFIRIYNNQTTDLLKWYTQAISFLRENERLLFRFLLNTGVRKEEGIISFNKIIELSKKDNMSIYYNNEFSALQHFMFKEVFLRNTKNVYISIIDESLVSEIANSEPVTYEQIRKRLKRNGLKVRINELRDFYGSFMVRHNLIKEEVDLLQGRIPPSIFLRHYWSPSVKELRNRTLEALKQLERLL
jgi:hypothetical protein